MLQRLLRDFISWVKTIFGIKPTPVGEALPQIIEESDIVKFARKQKRVDDSRYSELDKVQSMMKEKHKLIVETDRIGLDDHIITMATWLTEKVHGISIGIASPNLNISYRLRREIDALTEHRTKKINNKDTVIFDNDARIEVLTANRMRGRRIDVLILNAPEHIAESYLSNYAVSFGTIESHGHVLAFCEDIAKLKTTYFPGFSRLYLTDEEDWSLTDPF